MSKNTYISKAIKILGGQVKAGNLLGVSQQSVSYWLKTGAIPPKYAPVIQAETAKLNDVVHKEQLCPDFPWDKCCEKIS